MLGTCQQPIASINASALSTVGQESLLGTLRTIGAVVEEASIRLPLASGQRTMEAIVANEELSAALREAVARLAAAAQSRGQVC